MIIIYWLVAYWAAGRTLYKNRILIGTFNAVVVEKMIMSFLLGWILIPVAIIQMIFGRN